MSSSFFSSISMHLSKNLIFSSSNLKLDFPHAFFGEQDVYSYLHLRRTSTNLFVSFVHNDRTIFSCSAGSAGLLKKNRRSKVASVEVGIFFCKFLRFLERLHLNLSVFYNVIVVLRAPMKVFKSFITSFNNTAKVLFPDHATSSVDSFLLDQRSQISTILDLNTHFESVLLDLVRNNTNGTYSVFFLYRSICRLLSQIMHTAHPLFLFSSIENHQTTEFLSFFELEEFVFFFFDSCKLFCFELLLPPLINSFLFLNSSSCVFFYSHHISMIDSIFFSWASSWLNDFYVDLFFFSDDLFFFFYCYFLFDFSFIESHFLSDFFFLHYNFLSGSMSDLRLYYTPSHVSFFLPPNQHFFFYYLHTKFSFLFSTHLYSSNVFLNSMFSTLNTLYFSNLYKNTMSKFFLNVPSFSDSNFVIYNNCLLHDKVVYYMNAMERIFSYVLNIISHRDTITLVVSSFIFFFPFSVFFLISFSESSSYLYASNILSFFVLNYLYKSIFLFLLLPFFFFVRDYFFCSINFFYFFSFSYNFVFNVNSFHSSFIGSLSDFLHIRSLLYQAVRNYKLFLLNKISLIQQNSFSFRIFMILDKTSFPFNGCRAKK